MFARRMKYENSSVIIYRDKWLAVAITAGLGLFFFIGGILVLRALADPNAPTLFLLIFAGVWILVGALLLSYLPRKTAHVFKNKGEHIIVVNAAGVTLNETLWGTSRYQSWDNIAEIILAESFAEIDTDSKAHRGKEIILLFKPEFLPSFNQIEYMNSGIQKTGEDRHYLSSTYTEEKNGELQRLLSHVVPTSVAIRVLKKVVFDLAAQKDSYELH
ncbi:MAG: hypothetical protein V4805_05555 [Pseudomonadota bacterium]